jgi:exosortase
MDLLRHRTPILLTVLATGAVVWAYWATLVATIELWADDPQYSHGFLVPVFAGYLLWSRRGRLAGVGLGPHWWGVGVILAGAGLRMLSHALYQPWLDPLSLLVVLAGFAAATGGRRALAWAAPAILFLAFVIPLPYRFQFLLGGALQAAATAASTYALQTFGVPALAEGNVILLTDTRLGVVEACNGLSMLVTFFALATGVAIVARRSWPERIAIVLSAVPIAVIANVARITVTGLLFEANRGDLARAVFHDLAGWLMMPLALGMLLVELHVLGRLVGPAGGRGAEPRGPVGTSAAAPAVG